MLPRKTSRLQLLLAVVVIACSSTGPLSAANAIEVFPDSSKRASVVGHVVAPQVGELATTVSFTATRPAVKTKLRSGSSGTDAATVSDASGSSALPGGNGFGHVSYNENAPAARSASDSDSTTVPPVETQAEYRSRVWKAEKEAESKYPYLRMQNLVSF